MMTGKSRVVRQAEMAIEVVLLDIEGSIVPVAVQAGLADGDHPGPPGQGDDPVPIALGRRRRVVGLDADGGVETPVVSGKLHHGLARSGRDRRTEDGRHARRLRPGDHLVAIGRELRNVEMGVGVDHRISPSPFGRGLG